MAETSNAVALLEVRDSTTDLDHHAGLVAAKPCSGVGVGHVDVFPVGWVQANGLCPDEDPFVADFGDRDVLESGTLSLRDDKDSLRGIHFVVIGCRRRKIRCKYASPDDAVCTPCQQRGAACLSQEYDAAAAAASPAAAEPDKDLRERLGRLEALMGKLMERGVDVEAAMEEEHRWPDRGQHPSPGLQDSLGLTLQIAAEEPCSDLLGSSAVRNARRVACEVATRCPITVMQHHIPASPPDTSSSSSPAPNAAGPLTQPPLYAAASRALHALFPPPDVLGALAYTSSSVEYVLLALFSQREQEAGKPESRSVLAVVPPITSHPALLGKRLAQLAVSVQQLPPSFATEQLRFSKSIAETTGEWIAAVQRHVASNDDLITCQEGLECLLLSAFYLGDGGQLRKAWLTTRRALAMAQLLGLDRAAATLRSCDPSGDPNHRPQPASLWFRANCSDRYYSLILGLPTGSRDASFAAGLDDDGNDEQPIDKLGRLYTVIAGKIAERNEAAAGSSDVYGLTLALDLDLDRAAQHMNTVWWATPSFAGSLTACSAGATEGHDDDTVLQAARLKLQARHYLMLMLVHLPYLLRDGEGRRYEYNRATCMQAGRAILERFLEFRRVFVRLVSGRHIDYSALIAAMTLVLGYLRVQNREGKSDEMARDRALVEQVRDTMLDLGARNKDKLSTESADIITQLLPIVEQDNTDKEMKDLQLNVPFLAPAGAADAGQQDETAWDEFGTGWNWMAGTGWMDDAGDAGVLQGVDATYWNMVNGWNPAV
ncbi:hypothetical protein S40288_04373 [Stachybotrys chartarum IBT 40288]|nr:hypothetical protein S40288_04373 [Stachybotrys chartarum IBT 40288]